MKCSDGAIVDFADAIKARLGDGCICSDGKAPRYKSSLTVTTNRASHVLVDLGWVDFSGQPEKVSVWFCPKISASFGFGFGISVFSLFGVSVESDNFGHTFQYRVNCQNSILWPK